MQAPITATASSSTPSLVLVGIKRHRDQAPLKALVYGAPNAPPSPTLERSKKKRKVSEAEARMFMFAETMDASSWLATKKGEGTAELQSRIDKLAEGQLASSNLPNAIASSRPTARQAPNADPQRVYRILPRRKSAAIQQLGASADVRGTAPASIPEESELAHPFKYLEAELVPVDEASGEEVKHSKEVDEEEKAAKRTPRKAAEANDSEMDMFNDMVERFLKVNGDLEPDKPLKRPGRPVSTPKNASAPPSAAPSGTATPLSAKEALDRAIAGRESSTSTDDEYVYDLFYFSREKAAQMQMMQMMQQGQVASLTGMSAVFDETEEYTSGEDDSEVDEDSNDENYYQNDYPEEQEELAEWSDSEDDLERRQRIEDGLYSTENGWDDDEDGIHGRGIPAARAAIIDRFGRRQRSEDIDEDDEDEDF